jgi:4-hydroxythreonine-4-phosphate dehydrogenase
MISKSNLKRIAITMGDPGGVGPEVIVKALSHSAMGGICRPIVVGDAGVMEDALSLTGISLKLKPITAIADTEPEAGTVEVVHISSDASFQRGASSKEAGTAFVGYIENAAELAMNRQVDAIVTAPISKESMKMAGYAWPGHTELLAGLTNSDDFAMMFVSGPLKLILCTIHIPLKDVPSKIDHALVVKTIKLAETGACMLGIKGPHIAVAGLNPHAGESGIMGKEESTAISPAVETAQGEGIHVSGPFPPDVVFHRAYKGEFDIVVCMYHDQGLIPFKMLAFDSGVNVTVGLPIIRTSPDHGTAFDIAWKNKADPSSMIEAIKLAVRMELGGKS